METDSDCDGYVDGCSEFTYGSSNELIRKQDEPNCDGVPGFCWDYTYYYNEEGLVARRIDDFGCNGTGSTCWNFSYPSADNVKMVDLDENCDGTADEYRIITYDANGREIESHCDVDYDGEIDICNSYNWDCEPR